MRPQGRISVSVVSLGCPKNLVDSEKMLALLAGRGCAVAAPVGASDVILVNTCGFLASAREESLSVIREAVGHKAAGRASRVVVAGCLCGRGDLFREVPGIDAVVGVNDRDAIVRAVTGAGRVAIISDSKAHRPGVSGTGRARAILSDRGRFRLTPRHTAYLRIAEGCSRKCTFCAIPAIRGPYRSKTPRAVMSEAREMVADGAVELNVIAQDTTSFGRGVYRNSGPWRRPSLAGLLRGLDRIDGLEWIRLMYAYPGSIFTDELIDAIARCSRVVKYVDMPIQHISDPVLRRMGRGTSRGEIEPLLGKLRAEIPGVAIRTSLIVGFPGETERQFEELLDFVGQFRFDALGVFQFSAEDGTPAAGLPGQVAPAIKAERASAVMAAQRKIVFAANKARAGERMRVLVDRPASRKGCVGRHAAQAPDIDGVCRLSAVRPAGDFVDCVITGWDGYDLLARPARPAGNGNIRRNLRR